MSTGVLTQAVLQAGVVSEEQLAEMKRWNPPSLGADDQVEEPKPLEEAAGLVADALQSEGYVLMRETDLEAVRQYVATSTAGFLHIEVEGLEPVEIEVTYGLTTIGEYVFAWRSEAIREAMTNGLTWLCADPDGVGVRVFFKDVRELFFGTQKTFMVCTPSTVENVG